MTTGLRPFAGAHWRPRRSRHRTHPRVNGLPTERTTLGPIQALTMLIGQSRSTTGRIFLHRQPTPTTALVRRCHHPPPCRQVPNITSTYLTPTTDTPQHLIPRRLPPYRRPSQWELLLPHTCGKPHLVTPRWFLLPLYTNLLPDHGVASAKSHAHPRPKSEIYSKWRSNTGVFRTSWRNRWIPTTNHPSPVFIGDRDRAQVLQLTKSSLSRQHRRCARAPNPNRLSLPVIILTRDQDSYKSNRHCPPRRRLPTPPAKCERTWEPRRRVLLSPSFPLLLPAKPLFSPESDR